MIQHLYESHYKEQTKAMFIRFARKLSEINGLSPKVNYDKTMSCQDKYLLIRACMDIYGTSAVIERIAEFTKKNQYLVWLAWGHKTKSIQIVGMGTYTWQQIERKRK